MVKICKRRKFLKIITSAACILIASSATAAYATDIGTIQHSIPLWIHGVQTESLIRFDNNGSYPMDIPPIMMNIPPPSFLTDPFHIQNTAPNYLFFYDFEAVFLLRF